MKPLNRSLIGSALLGGRTTRSSLHQTSVRNRFGTAARWGLLGLVSGVFSCGMADSRMLYLVREQKTIDHIVWPGLMFALIVILPLSRLARDGWLRTAAAMVASCAVYPIAWYIAASTTFRPGGYMVAAFAFSGFLGSLMLANMLLFGRPGWVRAAGATVVLGTAIGGFMGAHLLATMKGMVSLGSAGDILAAYMVLWQAAVSVSLGRAVLPRPEKAAAPNGDPDAEVDNSRASQGRTAIIELNGWLSQFLPDASPLRWNPFTLAHLRRNK